MSANKAKGTRNGPAKEIDVKKLTELDSDSFNAAFKIIALIRSTALS